MYHHYYIDMIEIYSTEAIVFIINHPPCILHQSSTSTCLEELLRVDLIHVVIVQVLEYARIIYIIYYP